MKGFTSEQSIHHGLNVDDCTQEAGYGQQLLLRPRTVYPGAPRVTKLTLTPC